MSKKNGFTLVELMVVIVIIGILAAVAVPRVTAAIDKAKLVEAPQTLKGIATQQHVNYVETAAYDVDWTGSIKEPKSNTWKYTLSATDGFTATATPNKVITIKGVALALTDILTVDANDKRTATTALKPLIPDWDNQ
jgi:prepilin-type N-terminal cleavage/methylation domain-containing protein